MRVSAKPKVELIFTIVPMENGINVKYLESGQCYNVGLKKGQIGKVCRCTLLYVCVIIDKLQ